MTFAESSERRSGRTMPMRSDEASAPWRGGPAEARSQSGATGGKGRLRSTRPWVAASNKGGATRARTGPAPTPMLYLAETMLDVAGGIMITGSHNPAEYNGFKMVLGGRAFFGPDIQGLGAEEG